jgi:transcriptional regulator with XRE-family HTH domain
MEIGQRLSQSVRRLRQAKGWSQEELASRSGLHRTFISQVERISKTPTITSVEKIARALDVSLGELLD